jgi:hypothetical protein
MLKLITVLIGFCLALAASVQAAKPDGANKKSAQKQQAAPKQQHQAKAPKPQVQKVHPERANKPVTTNSAGPKVSKKQIKQTPVLSRTAPSVKPNKIEKQKDQVQTSSQQLKKTKPSKETVAKIRAQHLNFKAKPNTAIASAQFNPNYRIQAAQNWTGAQYDAFRTYQPQWRDQGWWSSHYVTVSLIGGGWYYWNAGYWYPAWGYDEAAAYYPYDGPIYVGSNPRPFDQVVADVQSLLQDMGFYKGEVDGLVGPLTQEAVAAYQASQGLPSTAAIDQPTLDSLGLAG